MRAVFIDTSLWYPALSRRNSLHATARSAVEAVSSGKTPLVTTSMVVAETHGLVVGRVGLKASRQLLDVVYSSGAIRVVHPDEETVRSAIARWVRPFDDQRFSLCDAVSFEVMQRERISGALAFDHHFAIAGFEIVN